MCPRQDGRPVVRLVSLLLMVSGLVWGSGVALAGSLSVDFLNVEVSSTLGTDSFNVLSADVPYDPDLPGAPGEPNGGWQWAGNHSFSNGIATLDSAVLTIVGDPQMAMTFTLTAGEAPTHVTITSAVLTFDALVNPGQCFATAGATLTDVAGSPPTAELTGGGGSDGTYYYAAGYNGSMIFGEFIQTLSAGEGESVSDSGSHFGAIAGSVTSMEIVFEFNLSAGDEVSATSNYIITPEPAGLALLALGGLAALRRRV
jgi:MYXO-CTERM domain-containing protein